MAPRVPFTYTAVERELHEMPPPYISTLPDITEEPELEMMSWLLRYSTPVAETESEPTVADCSVT